MKKCYCLPCKHKVAHQSHPDHIVHVEGCDGKCHKALRAHKLSERRTREALGDKQTQELLKVHEQIRKTKESGRKVDANSHPLKPNVVNMLNEAQSLHGGGSTAAAPAGKPASSDGPDWTKVSPDLRKFTVAAIQKRAALQKLDLAKPTKDGEFPVFVTQNCENCGDDKIEFTDPSDSKVREQEGPGVFGNIILRAHTVFLQEIKPSASKTLFDQYGFFSHSGDDNGFGQACSIGLDKDEWEDIEKGIIWQTAFEPDKNDPTKPDLNNPLFGIHGLHTEPYVVAKHKRTGRMYIFVSGHKKSMRRLNPKETTAVRTRQCDELAAFVKPFQMKGITPVLAGDWNMAIWTVQSALEAKSLLDLGLDFLAPAELPPLPPSKFDRPGERRATTIDGASRIDGIMTIDISKLTDMDQYLLMFEVLVLSTNLVDSFDEKNHALTALNEIKFAWSALKKLDPSLRSDDLLSKMEAVRLAALKLDPMFKGALDDNDERDATTKPDLAAATKIVTDHRSVYAKLDLDKLSQLLQKLLKQLLAQLSDLQNRKSA